MSASRVGLATLMAIALVTAANAADARAQYGQIPSGTVAAFPTRGTISASPRTQISFRGRPKDQLGVIDIRGSVTGRHRGRLVEHSDGQGASFVPSKPFRGGERVTVTTTLPIPDSLAGTYSFKIARTPRRTEIANLILEPIPPGRRRSFRSRPDLRPPVVTISDGAGATDAGLVTITPKSKIDGGQAGPMIIDNAGQPVWFQPLPGITAATDFRVQRYKGEPVLTWWQGTSRSGIGTGQLIIADSSYHLIKRLAIPNGYVADLHEFLITPQSTAIVETYPAVRADLSKFGGARNGEVIDSVVTEVDIETGAMLFEWHSLGAVPISDSFSKPAPSPRSPWDYFHLNSAGLDADGNYLVSGRNTWGIYKIDRVTGKLIWRLGGKRSTFKMPAEARFAWQHDARRRSSDGAITLFDNEAFPPIRKHSRVLALRLDEQAKTASVISAWEHPRGLLTATQGNQQTLPGGGAFVGWGSQRYFTEFGPGGNVVWDARLAIGYETYRAYRSPWVGRPTTRPRAAAVRRSADSVDVYASWNGSTETVTWGILAGTTADNLSLVTTAPRGGFETQVLVGSAGDYVAVQAMDAAGNVLATSPTVKAPKT